MNGSRAKHSKDRRGGAQEGRGGDRPFVLNLNGPQADMLALQRAAGNRRVGTVGGGTATACRAVYLAIHGVLRQPF